jgi:hypothetical protein
MATAPKAGAGAEPKGIDNRLQKQSVDTPSARVPQEHAWPYQSELESIADWRVDLTARIRRAELRFLAIGLSPEAIIELADEARAFKAICQWLRGEFAA